MPARTKPFLRRALLLGAVLLLPLAAASTASAGGISPAAVNTPVSAQRVPAPPTSPLHQLDFLLGTAVCTLSTGPILTTVTHPILNGTYYQIDMTVDRSAQHGQNTHGRWVLSWSATQSAFFSYYYDDSGLHGESGSPGTQNGALTFTGPYDLGSSGTHQIRDEFTVQNSRHFTIHEYLQLNDAWQLLDVQTCSKHAR